MRPQDTDLVRVLELVRDAVIVADAETGRIVMWNPAAERTFRYPASEALGLPVEALVPERFRARHRAGFARYRETGRGPLVDAGTPAEVSALRSTGEEISVELTLSPLEAPAVDGRFVLAVIRDVSERKRAEARARLLTEELEAAERDRLLDDERRRIARELHDRVEQTFFSIGLAAGAALEPGAEDSPERLRAALAGVRGLAAEGAEQLRGAIFALSHAEVGDRGLVQALWKLVRGFRQRSGVEADLMLAGRERRVPSEVAEVLHSVAREALANVERHAQASAVVLGLRFAPRTVTLTVQDDGIGASPLVLRGLADSTTHFGLNGLQQRVHRLRGTFAARPGEDGGFVVRAQLPLDGRGAR